ncbi:MAG: hypothetical protein ACOX3T_07525 [Bdellovibrionota bacterium]
MSAQIGKREYKITIGHAFRITLNGIKELKRVKGTSSSERLNKIVY